MGDKNTIKMDVHETDITEQLDEGIRNAMEKFNFNIDVLWSIKEFLLHIFRWKSSNKKDVKSKNGKAN